MLPRPTSSTLFPYTTLFRSIFRTFITAPNPGNVCGEYWRESWKENRSEEHTSEIQSRQYLVCRLLLEKKKPAPAQEPRVMDLMAALKASVEATKHGKKAPAA